MTDMTRLNPQLEQDLWDLSCYIYENPELGHEEFKSAEAHCKLLEKYGFTVERNYLGLATGFRAEYAQGEDGATISYLAEYDALPKVGHGCGHNILGTVSTGAAIHLAQNMGETSGRVVVIGTPAEETDGAKVKYAAEGAFDDVDVALIGHPFYRYERSGQSLAIRALRFTFHGKAAHAVSAREQGINALDACILTFNAIGLLRQQLLPSAYVHGIIKEGGTAANTIPDLAVAEFYVRAETLTYLNEVRARVEECARGGAAAAGARLEIEEFEAGNDNLVTNEKLMDILEANWRKVGIENIVPALPACGSSDIGNVSHVCPAIHPYYSIQAPGEEYPTHTEEFRETTLRQPARQALWQNACAMAMTGKDIMDSPQLLAEIKEEFEKAMETA